MKQYKQFIAGFVSCFILLAFIFIPGYADDALQIMLNPYPVFVNGNQVQVEGYNINGFTYLKLADIGKAFNSTSKFNETDQQIEITSNPVQSTSLNAAAPAEIKKTPDGIEIQIINGVECIPLHEINGKYYIPFENSYYISTEPDAEGELNFYSNTKPTMDNYKNNKTILVKGMPVIEVKGNTRISPSTYYIDPDYYENTILPLINIEPLY